MNFEELERLIRLSMLREKMEKLSSVSKKVGLAKTSSKEIDTIVKITRQRAKNSR